MPLSEKFATLRNHALRSGSDERLLPADCRLSLLPAALLLGLIARWARADRLTASLLLALGVGIWSYLQTAVSVVVVRQVPAEIAFRAAAELNAVYLPAALAGIAGALLVRERRPTRGRASAR